MHDALTQLREDLPSRTGVSPQAAGALVEALAALPGAEALAASLTTVLERIAAAEEDAAPALDALARPHAAAALARLAYAAPFLAQYVAGRPRALALGALEALDGGAGVLPWARYADPEETPGLEEADLMGRLRRWKYDNLLRITARDMMGFQDTAATCRAISDLADTMLRIAYAHAFGQMTQRHGLPLREGGGLAAGAVIGMGKLGGRELNFASDVDLIFIQEGDDTLCRLPAEDAEPPPLPPIDSERHEDGLWAAWRERATACQDGREGRITSGEFHNRLARQVTRVLSTQLAEGFGFRVDNDLRPGGSAGFLAPSLAFMEAYYIQHGREWERTAMLKARGVAGCPQVRARFDEMIRPFVYRRYLDFGALEGIAVVKHDIDRSNRSALESNLKLGRGGIRENEFLVQALQLLYGGKRPALRVTGHEAAVRALMAEQVIEPGEGRSILEDYWLLRSLENRIQMVGEQQTHDLPDETDELLRISHDFAPGGAERLPGMLERLEAARERNAARFLKLFAGLGEQGFPDAHAWRGAVEARVPGGDWRETVLARMDDLFSRLMLTRPGERCVFKLAKLLEREEVYRQGSDDALPRWLDFFEQIGNRNAIYALIETHPHILPWIAEIFSEGGRHAGILIRHPEFLETFFALGETWESVLAEFDEMLAQASDDEEFILELQGGKSRCLLRALTALLAGEASGEAGDPHRLLLSDLADAVVRTCTRFAWREVGGRLGYPEGGDVDTVVGFSVLAMGKLGSREMRLGSDLDLVYVCGPDGSTSRGRSNYEFYTKVAQKLNTLLTAPTQFGRLYELDHRLRPFGNKGVLVPALAAYRNYLMPGEGSGADIWNFQAFSRIRPVAGDAALAGELIALVAEAWRARRDEPEAVVRSVWGMLGRLVEQHGVPPGSREPALPLKFAVGGMIGYEFLQQTYFLLAQDADSSGWTAPPPHETLKRLAPDYAELGRLDERLSCFESGGRHEFRPEDAGRWAAIGKRWRYEEVAERCRSMEEDIAGAFRELGL